MKEESKLFDLFRDNEHKLHEYPSADAWLRLEKRLDAHRRRRSISLYRPIAIAAGLTLIIGTSFVLGWVANGAMQQSSGPVALDELPSSSGPDVYAQTLSVRNQYSQVVLDEGERGKHFRVNQPPQGQPDAVNPFSWLAGSWEGETHFEEWTVINEKLLKGVAFQMQENRRIDLKEMEILLKNGVWKLRDDTSQREISPAQFEKEWSLEKRAR